MEKLVAIQGACISCPMSRIPSPGFGFENRLVGTSDPETCATDQTILTENDSTVGFNIFPFPGCALTPTGRCTPLPKIVAYSYSSPWKNTAEPFADIEEKILTIGSYFECIYGDTKVTINKAGQDGLTVGDLFAHRFEGPRGELLADLMGMSDEAFQRRVNEGSIESDARFSLTGESVWGENGKSTAGRSHLDTLDLLAAGYPTSNYRTTRYFDVETVPGDGVVVVDFWISEDNSGGFLAGDGRGYVDPMHPELGLDDSRLTIIIDRESGRGMVTLSPTTIRVVDYPGSIDSLISDPFWARGTQYNDLLTVPARPIELGPNPGLTSGVHDNYFQITSDQNSISIDYDSINSVTAPLHVVSVDGSLNIEKGEDGLYSPTSDNRLNAYPSIAVVQYLPDCTQHIIYEQENLPVIPGGLISSSPPSDEETTSTPPQSVPAPYPRDDNPHNDDTTAWENVMNPSEGCTASDEILGRDGCRDD